MKSAYNFQTFCHFSHLEHFLDASVLGSFPSNLDAFGHTKSRTKLSNFGENDIFLKSAQNFKNVCHFLHFEHFQKKNDSPRETS